MCKLWIEAVRRDPKEFSITSNLFVCEDHFNLEHDMANYMEWKMMGVKKQMKTEVIPHIFDCQKDRKRAFTRPPRSAALKRSRISLITDVVLASTSRVLYRNPIILEEADIAVPCETEPCEKKQNSVGVQVKIRTSRKSKSSTQCAITKSTVCQSCSPIKVAKIDAAVSPITKRLFGKTLEVVSSESTSSNVSEIGSSTSDFENDKSFTSAEDDLEYISKGFACQKLFKAYLLHHGEK